MATVNDMNRDDDIHNMELLNIIWTMHDAGREKEGAY